LIQVRRHYNNGPISGFFATARVLWWIILFFLSEDRSVGYHAFRQFLFSSVTISMIESIALLDRNGCFVWVDEHAPWGFCRDIIMGTPAWKWVSSDNVEAVKTAYSRCLILNEPQQFQAEVSIDGRSVDMQVWLRSTEIDQAKIIATSTRLPTRVKMLTESEKEILKRLGEGMSPKKIAEVLDLSRATVDTHRRNIMQKLRIDDAHSLQAFAVRKMKLW
jgi:DNA-binding CsgD family transcriptional regulator